jgi:hypothetical protein
MVSTVSTVSMASTSHSAASASAAASQRLRLRPNQQCSLDRRVVAGVVLVGPALHRHRRKCVRGWSQPACACPWHKAYDGGLLGCWGAAVLRCWDAGMLARWHAGTLGCAHRRRRRSKLANLSTTAPPGLPADHSSLCLQSCPDTAPSLSRPTLQAHLALFKPAT